MISYDILKTIKMNFPFGSKSKSIVKILKFFTNALNGTIIHISNLIYNVLDTLFYQMFY